MGCCIITPLHSTLILNNKNKTQYYYIFMLYKFEGSYIVMILEYLDMKIKILDPSMKEVES
jgi:hypothetical protein